MLPKVSFVVPCYKLAHFLPECVNSILGQTYEDLEVLIMDDCSPDNTPEVAQFFEDPRVHYVRNEPNLGHLRNYNKGIGLAKGQYVWLISADDRLRKPYVLQRYVDAMERNPRAGYVFCSGVGLKDANETGVLGYYYYGDKDKIFDGRKFISRVLRTGGILSPAVMVRKECYEKVGLFPLDMPHQGDMYLWFMWALQYDVIYLADAMVNYRVHEENMTKTMNLESTRTVMRDELGVLWQTRHAADQKGFLTLARDLDFFIARRYAYAVSALMYDDTRSVYKLSVEECEASLVMNARGPNEARRVRSNFWTLLGDAHCWSGHFQEARQAYISALRNNVLALKVWGALLLAFMGNVGFALRRLFAFVRQQLSRLRKSPSIQTVNTPV